MATDITGSTILSPLVTKVENQDIHGKNWASEIVQLVVGSNSSATYTLNTSTTSWPAATSATGPMNITTPIFVTCDGADNAGAGYSVAYGDGSVVITWDTAPTSKTIRVKIEGWA